MMMKVTGTLMIACSAMLFATGAVFAGPTAEQQTAAFKTAVDDVFKTWSHSALTADSAEFGELWDANAVKMANGKPTVSGQANIKEMRRQKDLAIIFDTFDIKTDEYQLAGEFGWARGIYTIVTHPRAGGDASTDIGTFLTVFHKQADGSWRVYRDTMMTLP